ncbi:MAG: ABC transporter ATP-binding protein [Hyphomicrobiaceae bacterium]
MTGKKPEAGANTAVEFKNVSKVFNGSVVAVDDISLAVEAGTLVTLLGPSGCGKTTTLRMIAGLEFATSGTIEIGGRDVTRLPATERDVSMVFQSYALFPHMNVIENVSYGLSMSRLPKSDVQEQAREGLALVGLDGYASRLPSELSGGQQQRVAVARALVLEPQVLLFDEPLSNLDARLRRRVREEIRDLQTKLGLTVVYVTHDQEEALAVSDKIVVMNNAAIAQNGTPNELYDAPADSFVADFIGEANLLPCSIEAVADGTATVKAGTITRQMPARGIPKGEALLAVLPHRLTIANHGDSNGLPGILRKATFVGRHFECLIDTELGELFAIVQLQNLQHKPGSEVSVVLADDGPVLVKPA